MQTIKDVFSLLDSLFLTVWGFTIYDFFAVIGTGGTLSTIYNIIKLLFALSGLVYSIMRIYHFWHKSKIDRAIRQEELQKLEKENNG